MTDSSHAKSEEMLDFLQRETFDFFLYEADPTTGLLPDSTQPESPASVAVMGLAITSYAVAAERKIISRNEAMKRTLKVLHFFRNSRQGNEPDSTGYKGFYYHFIHKHNGQRAWQSELSTIDTAIFLAGVLSAKIYFDQDTNGEIEIRKIAEELYRRVDWQWACNGEKTLTHGWKPESGFLQARWSAGYSEAHILYILAMASPTYPISADGYKEWSHSFALKNYYGIDYIHAGPLFIHQMSQIWLDFRGLFDDVNRKLGFDYFENSRRATHVQRAYAIDNPHGFEHYSKYCWGITASDGPGPVELEVHGVKQFFYDYTARGVVDGVDDGTVSPWAVVCSIPFAPDITLETIQYVIEKYHLKNSRRRARGFDASFNPTFPLKRHGHRGWVSEWRFGLNQGPMFLMLENYRSGLVWKLLSQCSQIKAGMERAGFKPQARPQAQP